MAAIQQFSSVVLGKSKATQGAPCKRASLKVVGAARPQSSRSAQLKNTKKWATKAGSDVAFESYDEAFVQDKNWEDIFRLKNGFKLFREKATENFPELIEELKNTQEPKVMVIACADSRVSPSMLMQTRPGDIFVVRNVANMVPPYETQGRFHGTSAAIEFAVIHLKVEHIIVMGHSGCGGIKALMDKSFEDMLATKTAGMEFIPNWVSSGQPARERTLRKFPDATFAEQCRACEQESVNSSLSNLLTFPFIKEAIQSGQLDIHGWYYNLQELNLRTWTMDFKLSSVETI
mmetsp:Transcript_34053/g.47193  ORF Transcript_34053/g.47193 Transcript_34053/m.47193 type:complete len:290 (+) Transcript_34053:129-998(+)|eukprot:CAMPEP_0196573050 /NCGR_PEP_ID=MMETSP1081-20130531/3005_1 /TAXON_ID=36882 /ORGANISM="Pyramimonas amylifera, Strain CCMP720" /LENGTH=289 /DNA_ID=CAMNT_0041890615 /DNA_START=104 /DNA_END=973 /DNA_ORIENTATION=-